MDNQYSRTRQISEQEDQVINLQDILSLFVVKWRWFVLSVVLCIGLAGIYLLRTTPVYERSETILIKEDKGSGSAFSSVASSFDNLGLFNSNVNVNNEIAAVTSPATIIETVKRLGINYSFTEEGLFRDAVLYGTNLPYNVTIEGIGDNIGCSFRMVVDSLGAVSLSKFVLEGEKLMPEEGKYVSGVVGAPILTPLGAVSIERNPFYIASEDDPQTHIINVAHHGIVSCVKAYSTKLSAAIPDTYSSLINLSFTDASIQRAEDFLNTLVAVYNESWVSDKNQIAVSTSLFIEDRLRVIERELGEVDSDITSYRSENLITDVESASNMYMTQANELNNQILELNNQLYMAQYIRGYVASSGDSYELLPAVSLASSSASTQISEYNTTLLQRNNMVASSSVNNPLVVELDKNLAAMRAAILVTMDNDIDALNVQIRSLQSNQMASTSRIASTPQQSQYLLSTERQQKVKENLYLYLLQKREENELSQAFTAYNTRIITPPFGELVPASPSRNKIMLIAIFLGLIIPACVLTLKEITNTKVRGRKDLEKSSIPFLGEIPYCVDSDEQGLKYHLTRYFTKADMDKKRIVVKEGKRDVINEAFRVLRTNIEFVIGGEKDKNVIMFTSFNPHSGKSFLSMNIAISFAIRGKDVLIIDCDMRHCSVSAYVDNPEYGLADYLSGRKDDVEGLIVQGDRFKHLYVLPVGTIPPNPAELLSTEGLKNLVEGLRGSYDYIFIDCPPAEIVADAQLVSKVTDRTIFVVRAGLLEREMLDDLEVFYSEKKFGDMTLILNGTQSARGRSGKGAGYRYGYRYGYGYGYGYGYQYSSDSASSKSHHHHGGGNGE